MYFRIIELILSIHRKESVKSGIFRQFQPTLYIVKQSLYLILKPSGRFDLTGAFGSGFI